LHKIKLIIFDVDGIFTDGSVYLDKDGNEYLRFSRIDGKGIELARNFGIQVAVISSEKSTIVEKLMEKLRIVDVYLGEKNKIKSYEELKKKYNFSNGEICFCGDDVQDLEVLNLVGLSACPQNAVQEVKNVCDYISGYKGGEGFVREICDMIIKTRSLRQ